MLAAHPVAAERAVALGVARLALLDGLACMLETLDDSSCAGLLGPPLPGMTMAGGARIPGTSLELDPVQAAFSLGVLLRWCDAGRPDDGASRGHPHDCLGALLALFDYRARRALHAGHTPPTLHDLLLASDTATQLQRRLVLPAALDCPGLRVRLATALVAAAALGAGAPQLHAALAECLLDGRSPDAMQRRWSVADAGSRGLWHALHVARRGESAPGAQPQQPQSRQLVLCAAIEAGVPAAAAPADDAGAVLARLQRAVGAHFTPRQAARIAATLADPPALDALRVSEFIAHFVRNA